MPKYIPTNDDNYSTKPCAICGSDVFDENSETCCDLCEEHWIMFKKDYEEDYEQSMIDEFYRDLDNGI